VGRVCAQAALFALTLLRTGCWHNHASAAMAEAKQLESLPAQLRLKKGPACAGPWLLKRAVLFMAES